MFGMSSGKPVAIVTMLRVVCCCDGLCTSERVYFIRKGFHSNANANIPSPQRDIARGVAATVEGDHRVPIDVGSRTTVTGMRIFPTRSLRGQPILSDCPVARGFCLDQRVTV